jgi:hypothetical protein
MKLSFDTTVGFLVRVIFPNSRKVLFEKAEAGNPVREPSSDARYYLLPKFQRTWLLIFGFFREKAGVCPVLAIFVTKARVLVTSARVCGPFSMSAESIRDRLTSPAALQR